MILDICNVVGFYSPFKVIDEKVKEVRPAQVCTKSAKL